MIKAGNQRLAFSVIGLVWAILFGSPIAQGGSQYSELRFSLKQDLVARINRDRAKSGLRPVQLDPHASAMADRYCDQQIREGTTGHFTLDGNAPYIRYSLAGGNDGLSQNAAAWSANYSFTDSVIPDLINRSEDVMLAEVPPHDGHRRAILDPDATHVGIGLSWQKGEFRMTQEFLRRYVQWDAAPPRNASLSERVIFSARPLPGYHVIAMSVHHEPFPQPMSAVVANKIETYSLPKTRHDFIARTTNPRGRLARLAESNGGVSGDLLVRKDGSFSFIVPFNDGPGVYTLVTWVRKNGSTHSISASNISMKVEEARASGAASALGSR